MNAVTPLVTSRLFTEMGIATSVFVDGKKQHLPIDENDGILLPAGLRPQGFKLTLEVPKNEGIFLVQKDVGETLGGYDTAARSRGGDEDFTKYVTNQRIDVKYEGDDVRTAWHQQNPNRVDCWQLLPDGTFSLFQIGVIATSNAPSFRVLGDWRWKGRLFQGPSGIVGKPEHPKWGEFAVRKKVLELPAFKKLLKNVQLEKWQGSLDELKVPVLPPPAAGYARVQWYVPFAGRSGMGPLVLHPDDWDRWCKTVGWAAWCRETGFNIEERLPEKYFVAWVHGEDADIERDADGIKRLWQGDLVKFEFFAKFGMKEHRLNAGEPPAPPKITKVTKVS